MEKERAEAMETAVLESILFRSKHAPKAPKSRRQHR